MSKFLGDWKSGLAALRNMNSDLQKYPILKDVKRLEREMIAARANAFQKEAVLLDVGCGLGEDMHALKERIKGRIVGIDNNPLAVKLCKRDPRLGFLLMDAKDMGFADSAFDVSYAALNTLGNYGLSERHIWLGEMLRVSKVSLPSLYINTGKPEEMGIEDRLAYYRGLVARDLIFDGRKFMSVSRGWASRLFTLEEIDEMFRVYGIKDYEVKRLNGILLSVSIPAQTMRSEPDFSKVRLLSWDV